MCLKDLKYILAYLDVCYVILITGCFNLFTIVSLFPFFVFFSKLRFFYLSGTDSFQTIKIFNSMG